jgi:hypothetical protein
MTQVVAGQPRADVAQGHRVGEVEERTLEREVHGPTITHGVERVFD